MSTLKKFRNYILMVIGMALLTSFLIFVGFNANYKPITLKNELSSQLSIEKAEANSKQGRVYGYVKNSAENNLNGKYIKVLAYNSSNEKVATQFLKIENLGANEEKLFRANFNAKSVSSYEISISDNNV